jgi:hypothetical protein
MASFEITVNGELRFADEDIRAITVVADPLSSRKLERIYVHVGVGEAGENQAQYLGGDLRPGDELSIRVLADESRIQRVFSLEVCSFCGKSKRDISSCVAGPQVAICVSCVELFHMVIKDGGPLPIGSAIVDQGDHRCSFCLKSPPEVAGLFARNNAAICPECLRVCMDLVESYTPYK